MSSRTSCRELHILVGALLVFATTACPSDDRRDEAATPRPTTRDTTRQSAPPRYTLTLDDSTRKKVASLVGGAAFDTVPGAGDFQPLTVGKCPNCGFGPRARIQPESRAHENTRRTLASGRILARLVNLDTMDYRKLALPRRDTSYWYVDSTARGWRSLFIPRAALTSPTLTVAGDTLIIHEHYDPKVTTKRWTQAIARWAWSDADDGGWATCSATACCGSVTSEMF